MLQSIYIQNYALIDTLDTVSYTHLDVYKRQLPLSSIFFISLQNDYEQQKVKMKANKVLFITQELSLIHILRLVRFL